MAGNGDKSPHYRLIGSRPGGAGGGAPPSSPACPRNRVVAFAVLAVILVVFLAAAHERQKQYALSQLRMHDLGEPLLLIAIISCRAKGCERARRMLRTESWVSLLDQRALVNGTRAADTGKVYADTGHGWDDWRRTVKYVFVIGRQMPGVESSTPEQLAAEQELYHDMVFFDVDDDHASFTHKTRELIKWFDDTDPCYTRVPEGRNITCSHARTGIPLLPRHSFYMKVDDDVFVHPQNLAHYLRWNRAELAHVPTQFRGRLFSHTLWSGVVIRNITQRFADPSFPRDLYPPYPWGAAYIFNRESLSSIASIARSPFAPTYVNEDTTVGVWMDMVGPNAVQHIDEWRFWTEPGRCFDSMLTYHIGTPQHPHTGCTLPQLRKYKDWETATTHRQFADLIRHGCTVCQWRGCVDGVVPELLNSSVVPVPDVMPYVRFEAPGIPQACC